MSKVKSGRGLKFIEKYDVETAQVYKGDSSSLRIPPPNHPLYDRTAPTTFDPIRVEEIDASGEMTDAIEVWTDPDKNILWVIDGRGRLLDTREVNRRRAADGRELVKPHIKPLNLTEKEAVARVRVKNYHRRTQSASDMAIDVAALRKAGWSWAECVTKLHRESADPEQWCRKILPLAYCVDEVRAAFDSGELPKSMARKFGGGAPDGSAALGRQEQLALLAEKRAERGAAGDSVKRAVTPAARVRVRAALTNGATKNLCHDDAFAAEVAAATLAFVDGDDKALKSWPEVMKIVREAVKGRKGEAE